jgi:hypothetical protein
MTTANGDRTWFLKHDSESLSCLRNYHIAGIWELHRRRSVASVKKSRQIDILSNDYVLFSSYAGRRRAWYAFEIGGKLILFGSAIIVVLLWLFWHLLSRLRHEPGFRPRSRAILSA